MLTRLVVRNFKQFAEILGNPVLFVGPNDPGKTSELLPNLLRQTDHHRLATYVPPDRLSAEVGEILDLIAVVAARATPGPTTS